MKHNSPLVLLFSLFLPLSFFLSLPCVQSQEYSFITTGRGAIGAVQLSSTAYGIKEVEWNPWDDKQHWMIVNSDFDNSVFIFSLFYEGLVWDISGYHPWSGAQVILYQKKSTEVETRNQRWQLTSDGKLATILNSNYFVNITTAQNVVLAPKSTVHNSYQTIFIMWDYDATLPITIENSLSYSACLTVSSIAGFLQFDCQNALSTTSYTIPLGSNITIKDGSGNDLLKSFNITGYNLWIRLPVLLSIPLGTAEWSGWIRKQNQQTYNCELTLTFDSSYYILGTGTDYYGSFQFAGTYGIGGDVVFSKSYGTQYHECTGLMTIYGTSISGTCTDYVVYDEFYYELSV